MVSAAQCYLCSQARGQPTSHGPGPGSVPFEQCLSFRPQPTNASRVESEHEMPEDDVIDHLVARLQDLHAKTELVIKKLHEATERRRVLRERLQRALNHSES